MRAGSSCDVCVFVGFRHYHDVLLKPTSVQYFLTLSIYALLVWLTTWSSTVYLSIMSNIEAYPHEMRMTQKYLSLPVRTASTVHVNSQLFLDVTYYASCPLSHPTNPPKNEWMAISDLPNFGLLTSLKYQVLEQFKISCRPITVWHNITLTLISWARIPDIHGSNIWLQDRQPPV